MAYGIINGKKDKAGNYKVKPVLGKRPVILSYSKDENIPTGTWIEYNNEYGKLIPGSFVDFAHKWRKDPTTAVIVTEGLTSKDEGAATKELWIINKKMFPDFLDVGIVSESPTKYTNKHLEFIAGVRRFHPEFSFPYLAFLGNEDRYYLLQDHILHYYYSGSVSDLLEKDKKLDWMIEKSLEGFFPDWNRREYTLADIKAPITGIVEFSEAELYPEAMKKLGQKYKINRLVITTPRWVER